MLSFVSQLKAGKGLTLVALCLEGDFNRDGQIVEQRQDELEASIRKHKIKGFCDVLMTENLTNGVSCMIQVGLK